MKTHSEDSYAAQKARRWIAYAERLAQMGEAHRAKLALLTALDTITRRLAVLTEEIAQESNDEATTADAEAIHRLAYAARRALRYRPGRKAIDLIDRLI